MVRKLGKNLLKQAKKEMKDIKAMKNEEVEKNLSLAYLSISGSRILKECLELFRLKQQFENWKAKGNLRKDLDLKFNNYIFCVKSFKTELSVIKQLFNYFKAFEDKPKEIRYKMLSIAKNEKMKTAHSIMNLVYIKAFQEVIEEHTNDITDRNDLYCISNMLYILSSTYSIKDLLAITPYEELKAFYSTKEITRLKQLSTRLINLMWGILEQITAFRISKEEIKQKVIQKIDNVVVTVDKDMCFEKMHFEDVTK
ncbi:hypothetical protein [Streptobacillus moniliformis]|uniref:hypothetical protein n=2 Tax=Streptobacillus moniliformis TaxID=34105 RepID=UPI0007E3F769|nr:hypothetical protein [Streptobacillus moniliformis]